MAPRSVRASAWIVSVALSIALAGATAAEKEPAPTANALLDALEGEWEMSGTVMGEPVRYRAEGERVLQGGFVRLHMIDVSSPPQYEASVYIGYDPKANDFIAHWLDNFGAAGARVVGTGSQDGNRIVLHYPYASGKFRNTFTWSAAARSWTLLIESQGREGKWSTFANYTLEKVH